MASPHLTHPHSPATFQTAEIRLPKGTPEVGRWVCIKQGNQEVLWQIAAVVESPDDDCLELTLVPMKVP